VVLALLSSFVTLSVGERSYDDAYITYRYARNLSQGRGFAYNVDEKLLGTTTPLLTLLLALPARALSADLLPLIGQLLSGLALFFCASLAYVLARDDHMPVAGIVSSLLLVLNPVLPQLWGGEALLLLALVMGGVYGYTRGWQVPAGGLIGLAYLTRGEGALAALVLAAHAIVVKRSVPWRAGLAFAGVVGTWTTYAWVTFGSPFPSTLQAKIAQMQSGYFAPFLSTSLRQLAVYAAPDPTRPEASLAYVVVFGLAGLGVLFLLVKRPSSSFWLVFAWIGLYACGYALLRVPFYHWYMAPLVLGGALLAGLGVEALWQYLASRRRRMGPLAWNAALVVVGLIVLAPLGRAGKSIWDLAHRPPSPAQRLYSATGRWLRQNTLPTDTVGYFEIGFIGFYGDRTMIDPVGLATPGAWSHVAQGDFLWAYLAHKPDYVLVNAVRWYDRIGRIRDEPWFEEAYEEVTRIEEPGYYDSPLTVYRKMDGAAVPDPAGDVVADHKR
jgi:hypothetical protein